MRMRCQPIFGILCCSLIMASVAMADETRLLIPEPVLTPSPVMPAEMPPPAVASDGLPVGQPNLVETQPGPWRHRLKTGLQAWHWGWAEEFDEPPLGACVNAHREVQICNGLAAQMVLYGYDFCSADGPDAASLNVHGQQRLWAMVELAHHTRQRPIGIERSGNPALDAARRAQVIGLLRISKADLPETCVVIGCPTATGLSGVEARLIYENLLQQTRSGGPAFPAGGSGGFSSQHSQGFGQP